MQGANKQSTTSASTWVIAQAQARFANSFCLDMWPQTCGRCMQGANKQSSTSASTWVIAQAQARFAKGLGLEMKEVEILPSRLAGKAEGELGVGACCCPQQRLLLV